MVSYIDWLNMKEDVDCRKVYRYNGEKILKYW